MFNISAQELKILCPRVALYVGVAYMTIRGLKFGVNSVAKLVGVKTNKCDGCDC